VLFWFCLQIELEKVKKRRLEREREREERDKEQEMLQRDKELDYFREWEKQEDTVSIFYVGLCSGYSYCGIPLLFLLESKFPDYYY
jgi:hypothetical protein